MKREISAEDFEGLAEPLKEEYAKGEDGVFRLNLEGDEGLDGLKKTLAQKRKALEQAEEQLAQYRDPDGNYLDVKSAREALEKLDKIRNWTPDEKAREYVAEQVKQEKDRLTAEIEDRDKRLAEQLKENDKLLIDNEVRRLMETEEHGLHGDPERILPYIRQSGRVKIVREKGPSHVQILREDGEGTEIVMKDGKAADASLKDFLASLKKHPTWSFAFFAPGAKGVGSPSGGDGGGGGGWTPEEWLKLTPEERINRDRQIRAGRA